MSEPKYFPVSEDIVDILVARTQSQNRHFFRILVAYYFSKVASMMRTNIQTKDRGDIPVNTYAINLMPSGAGKGFSTNIIEEQLISGFKEKFLQIVFPTQSAANIERLATIRARRDGIPDDLALSDLEKEFDSLGKLAFSFDSGTSPAVKQMRQKLLLASAGSMNLELDEVGSNITSNAEMLNTFLELYDVGKVKQKLTKNTAENKRSEEIDGKTPTNMMLFGTPTKLLDGSKVEDEFKQMLETGYARRMLFGYDAQINNVKQQSAEDLYEALTNNNVGATTKLIHDQIASLATLTKFNRVLDISKENTIHLLKYKIKCEEGASEMKAHQETLKAELSHRYYKALKLAGAYAFIDGSDEILLEHLDSAIQLVEDSGIHFNKIMTKEGSYVRLAKYIADIGKEVTQVDLIEELPFYKGTESQKKDMLSLAIAYGYKNNIIIKKTYVDDIEFLAGESLEETDLENVTLSYGTDITTGFEPVKVPFARLPELVSAEDYHYTAHHFIDGYRTSDKAIPGFDLAIIDVDGGISLETAKSLLDDYTVLFATTKRHTDTKNRFRVIFPLSHYLKLNAQDYSKFMENLFNWLPFESDTATKDIARKWMSHPGEYHFNKGQLLDATLFIPQTKKATEQANAILDAKGMDNMERWFCNRIEVGNRATMLVRYGFMLVDNNYPLDAIRYTLIQFNEKMRDPISQEEIDTKIMISISKKLNAKEAE